jgi:hypothetical protein
VDLASLFFVLSAITPEKMAGVLRNVLEVSQWCGKVQYYSLLWKLKLRALVLCVCFLQGVKKLVCCGNLEPGTLCMFCVYW